jgi:hypothetical protein
VIILAIAAVGAAAILFGSQLGGLLDSFRTVAVGVHNGTSQTLLVSAVVPNGDRAFYTVAPSDTRLIPDDPNEVITILDAACRVLDAHERGHQPPAFLLADVTATGVTWRAQTMPPGIVPAGAGTPCTVE